MTVHWIEGVANHSVDIGARVGLPRRSMTSWKSVHPIPVSAARADRVAPAEHIAARGLGVRAKADVFALFE